MTGFRVHDWRHDWAARFVMAGGDLRTLMDVGGWSSLRMVQRYAWITPDHAAAAVARGNKPSGKHAGQQWQTLTEDAQYQVFMRCGGEPAGTRPFQ